MRIILKEPGDSIVFDRDLDISPTCDLVILRSTAYRLLSNDENTFTYEKDTVFPLNIFPLKKVPEDTPKVVLFYTLKGKTYVERTIRCRLPLNEEKAPPSLVAFGHNVWALSLVLSSQGEYYYRRCSEVWLGLLHGKDQIGIRKKAEVK